MGNITIQGDLTGDVPGGEVGGASNLTTVGAIPYVSAAKTLNQDPTALFWDAANDRLRVGGAAGSGPSVLIGNNSSLPGIWFGANTTSPDFANFAFLYDGVRTVFNSPSNGGFGQIALRIANTTFALLDNQGNFLIGPAPTNGNFKLDVQASGSAGTARFYGGAGVSDTTKVVVRAGAGQSGNLLEAQSSAGSSLFVVNSTGGGSFAGSFAMATGAVALDSGLLNTGTGLKVGSGSGVYWNSASSVASTNPDLSLSRASAGVLQVGDGGSNANGYIGFGNGAGIIGTANSLGLIYTAGQIEFRSPTASRLMTLGGTGTISVYNETATTGVTKAVIRAGAGQSTTNLTEWQNSAGTVILATGSTGRMFGPRFTSLIDNGWALQDDFDATDNLLFASSRGLAWSSTASFAGSKDIGLRRAAAGYLKVTDGSTGLGKIVVSQSTPAASTDAGTAGAIWADANYIYVQTAAGTIKRVALTTF